MEPDLSGFCCQNQECADHGQRGKGNLKVDSWYGKNKEHRMLLCHSCGKRFSERKGTILFNSQLSEAKIELLRQYLTEGKSVREIALLIQVNRNTVVRYHRLFAETRIGDGDGV